MVTQALTEQPEGRESPKVPRIGGYNGVLNHRASTHEQSADATIIINRSALNKVIVGESTLAKEIESGEARIEGKQEALHELVSLLDTFEFWFNIVTP